MSDAGVIEVSILERSFHIACRAEDEAGVRQAVEYLDRKMRELRDGGKVIGYDRIAITVALNITHELLTLRLGNGFDMGSFKRRMQSMSARIDQTLAAQDELF
ncbi:MAG: cell division protein ZapA [Burkholderiales bacterium]|nr:cell division protein ZapA [Burkholderiales bacterium]